MDDELEEEIQDFLKRMGQKKLPRNTYGNIGRRTGKLITTVGKIHEISHLFVSSDSELSEASEPTNKVIEQKSRSERRRLDPPPTFLTDSESNSEDLDCSKNISPVEGDNTSTDKQQENWKKIHPNSETSTEVGGKSEQESNFSRSEADDSKKRKGNSNNANHEDSLDRADASDLSIPKKKKTREQSLDLDSDEEFIIEPLDKSSFMYRTKAQETAKTTVNPRENKRQEIEKLLSPVASRSEPDIVEDEINKISPIPRLLFSTSVFPKLFGIATHYL